MEQSHRVSFLRKVFDRLDKDTSSKELDSIAKRRHEPLVHYTSLDGMAGIVKSNDLWLTNARYSNDHEELLYGLKLIRETIVQHGEVKGKQAQDFMRELAEEVEKSSKYDTYVCCFCSDPDLLSQWRAYGGNGSGVNVAFPPDSFHNHCNVYEGFGMLALWDVTYDRDMQRRLIQEIIDIGKDEAERTSGESVAQSIAFALFFFAMTFKDSAFSEEREWRLMYSPLGYRDVERDLKFRARGGLLIPYLQYQDLLKRIYGNLEGIRLPIKTITIGPSSTQDLTVESTIVMARVLGLEDTQIAKSKAPYRG